MAASLDDVRDVVSSSVVHLAEVDPASSQLMVNIKAHLRNNDSLLPKLPANAWNSASDLEIVAQKPLFLPLQRCFLIVRV